MVGRAKKSHGGFSCPTALWTCSTRVFSVVDTCADGQRFGSSSRWWSLFYFMVVRHGHDVFGTRCLRRIMGYRWYDFVSNQQLLRETDSRLITSIACQCQLWLYGHMACYLEVNPAYHVVSERDNPAWRRPRPTELMAAASYLVWERSLHGDSWGVTTGSGAIW